jgi:hypothetical protein
VLFCLQLRALLWHLTARLTLWQDCAFEEALKFRWYTTELQFDKVNDYPRYVLVGCPEVIYTEHISAIGRFMALQVCSEYFLLGIDSKLTFDCRTHRSSQL